jgi:hypothetical protein
MRRAYRAADLTDAYLLLHRLQHRGIAARVLNEHARGALGEIPFTHAGPEVWVEEDNDYERARLIVVEHESAGTDAGTRRCAACGEDNPAGFETCWRCGRMLGGR